MGLRRKLLGGGGVLLGGQVLGQACSFVRNVVIARLLTPEDFGIAAALGMAMSLVEMVSNLAVDRLLVQAEDGNDPVFQATAHAFQVIRGIGLALILFLLAWPASQLFDIPHARWAFQCVALVPLIRGFMHLDPKRVQREFSFAPDVATELVPQVFLLIAAWPFVWWFKDYSAMLWLLVWQAATMVATSHALAERRYSWAWDRDFFRRMVVFGWPLLLNGLLMFLVFQGDQLVVGAAYDMTQLGVFSAAFTITFVPTLVIAKVSSALLLPLLSRVQSDFQKFVEFYSFSNCGLCLIGIAFSTGFILLGQQVVVFTFGNQYAAVDGIIGWLAVMQMLRVQRIGPTIAAMANGDTRMLLVANIGRTAAFPLAIWLALTGKSLQWVVIAGCLGELLALLILVNCLERLRGLQTRHTLRLALIASVAVAIAFALCFTVNLGDRWYCSAVSVLAIIIGTNVAMIYLDSVYRGGLLSLLRFQLSHPIQGRGNKL